jgi:hypothetical protein
MATETLTRGTLPRVQWGPVITGVLCALAAQIVLGLFGAAFGFASAPAGNALEVLAAVWTILTPIVASFIGAYIAVRVAGDRDEAGAFLHGALVWCIGLIAGAVFITGSLASGAMSAGTAMSGNVGARAIERRDTSVNRARAQATAEDAAKGAAAGTGAAGVAALFGLGGAILGAAVGRRTVTGRTTRRGERRFLRHEDLRHDEAMVGETGVAYGERGRVTTRPDLIDRGVDRAADPGPPRGPAHGDEPGMHH